MHEWIQSVKTYPELLDIVSLSEKERHHDLQAIFKRDIEDNLNFAFRSWRIYPIKVQGEADMGRLFKHLTCEEIEVECEDGKNTLNVYLRLLDLRDYIG